MKVIRGVVLVCLLGVPGVASSAPVLGAGFTPGTTNLFAHLSDLTRAQTFTVERAGLLTGFDVLLSTPDSFTSGTWEFGIHATDAAGLPVFGSSPLVSASVSYSHMDGGHFFGADVSGGGLFVTPGQVYALVGQGRAGAGASNGWWEGRFYSSLYGGGEGYTNRYLDLTHLTNPSSAYLPLDDLGADLGFRVWVDSEITPDPGPAVPEPATLLLLGSGLIGVVASRRRR